MVLTMGCDSVITRLSGAVHTVCEAHGQMKPLVCLPDAGGPHFIWQDGRTPLYLAAGRGHAECVKLLLDGSANVDAADKVSEGGVHEDEAERTVRWDRI